MKSAAARLAELLLLLLLAAVWGRKLGRSEESVLGGLLSVEVPLPDVIAAGETNGLKVDDQAASDERSSGELGSPGSDVYLSDASQLDVEHLVSVSLKPEEPAVEMASLSGQEEKHLAPSGTAVDKELSALESSLLTLAKEGASPETEQFVDDVGVILDDMQGTLWDDYNTTNVTLYNDWRAIFECEDAHLGADIEDYNIPALEAVHRSCRTSQYHAHQDYLNKAQLAFVKKQLMDHYCNLWNQNESDTHWPGQDECLYLPSDYDSYSEDMKLFHFYDDQYEFWSNYYQIIRYARERCDNATDDWQTANTSAESSRQHWQGVKANCTLDQDNMEGAGCDYRDAAFCPSGYLTCYTNAVVTYNATSHEAQEHETSLQDQMRAILRIDCLVSALAEDDVDAAIQVCVNTTYYDHPNVTALEYPDYPIPPPDGCDNITWDEHVPGYNPPYADKYYADCFNLTDLCDARCCDPDTGTALNETGEVVISR